MIIERWKLLSESIRTRAAARPGNGVAVVPFLTAGYPSKEGFVANLLKVSPHAAAIEIGVPFSDPMADGVTIQESSRVAITNGVTLDWIFSTLAAMSGAERAKLPPLVLMGYLNPFLMMGLERVAVRCAESGIAALIVPDLPMEEGRGFRAMLREHGTGLVQLVSPVTPPERAAELCGASDGFVYAVTVTGVTGGAASASGAVATPAHSGLAGDVAAYLVRLGQHAGATPVCAGFGISSAGQVRQLSGICAGAIVGSAVIRCLERGDDVGAFVAGLVAQQP